jgi:hypothetical protein
MGAECVGPRLSRRTLAKARVEEDRTVIARCLRRERQ